VLVQYISDPFTASLSLLSLRGTKCRSNLRGGRWATVRLLRSARNDDDSVSLVTSLIKVKESLITTVGLSLYLNAMRCNTPQRVRHE